MRRLAYVLIGFIGASTATAQLAPTGAHYAGRQTDTGHGGTSVSNVGGYATSIQLDLPTARGGLPVPLQIVYGGRTVGAAGLGWDLPLSNIQQRRTFAHRRPSHRGYVPPQPRQRTFMSLMGSHVELVPRGSEWVARTGSLELLVRQVGGSWLAYDGAGRTYTFIQPAQLTNSGLWLLKSISAAGGARLELTYQLNQRSIEGGAGIDIDLLRVAYNTHPATGCAKHEIALAYGPASQKPLSLTMVGEQAFVRHRTLSTLDVLSRATCNTALQRLRRYEFHYLPDEDTATPRLHRVRMLGRQGTAEEQSAILVGSYEYGTASRGGTLHYDISQTILLPPEDDGTKIAGTVLDSSVVAPGSGDRYALWQSLTDVTGDGRPDLILKTGTKLGIALNQPAPGGKTVLGAGPGVVPLHDTVFNKGAFSTQSQRTRRFMYAGQNNDGLSVLWQANKAIVAANHNVVDVWRQAIDVNGDGRVDIVDAAEQPLRWVIYLNTPGGVSGVKWKRTAFSVAKLAAELSSRGHLLPSNRVPLSRKATSGSVKLSTCWRWLDNEEKWVWFTGGWGQVCFGDPTRVLEREPERTLVEWEVSDMNGDGYPDFVYNSTPVRFQLLPPDPWSLGEDRIRYGDRWVPFAPAEDNDIRIAYNIVGVRFDVDEPNPFSRSVPVHAPAARDGVAAWTDDGGPNEVQRQVVGLMDVNGDGLVDRVVNRKAYLGVYIGTARTFSNIQITLPGPMSAQAGEREQDCATKPRFTSRITHGVRDLTGDGIPDYYGNGGIWIGTGTGFAAPKSVTSAVNFVFSHQTESCNGEVSNTDGGLFDIDGDGQPEVIGIVNVGGQRAYVVSQLAGSSSPRTPEAGKLISIDNGFGAKTRIRYQSAKEDRYSSHQVPFPEIVVSFTETEGSYGLGGSLAGVRYAYGTPQLVFDGWLDTFTFTGYRRLVEMYPYGTERAESFATVTDTWPLTSLGQATTKQQRWLRNQRVGRVRDVYTLRASATNDAWSLLGISASDTRVIGVTHQEWDAKLYEEPVSANWNWRDCLEMADPFDLVGSIGLNKLDSCRAHGFAFSKSSETWYGGSPPPSSNNIQTRTETRVVDDFGRVLIAELKGDLFRSDDDVCIESSYATPVQAYPRVLSAVTSERVTDCRGRLTYAGQAWRYDGLAAGLVSAGHVTSHYLERRATDNGVLLRTVKRFDATYDAAGNLSQVSTQRDGATRAVSFDYDPFGLVEIRTRVTGSGVPATESSTTLDQISLEALVQTDMNDTQRGAQFDGFGRLVRSTITPPGGQPGVLAVSTYAGYEEGNQSGRRIVVKGFTDPVPPANVASISGRTSTVFLDELGRERRTEVDLGSDYAGEVLVVGAREFDSLGRVAFEADPYPLSSNPATPYGTTYHYKRDREPACFIRGHGRQALTNVPNPAAERFPTCFQRTFVNHLDTLETQDSASLQSGTPQSGVRQRMVTSAIGRPIELSTIKGATRLDHATFTHDRLGQLKSITRYANPASAADPVQWSWRMDSIGHVLRTQEPASATRFYAYSDWGEMTEVRWNDGGVDRRLVRTFDALGRLDKAEERNNGIADPETLNTYTYDVGISSPHLNPTFTLGRLSRASAPTGDIKLSYDAHGNVNAKVFTDTANQEYVERFEYHADGRLAAISFELPDTNFQPERVKYAYDSADRMRAVYYSDALSSTQLYSAEAIDVLGRVRKAMHGATKYSAQYTDAGRNLLAEALIESAHGARQVLYLDHDGVGRELVRRETTDGAATGSKLDVGYDALGRLSSTVLLEGTTTLGSRQISYDALGNVLAFDDAIGDLDATLTYDSVDRDRICRIGYGNAGLGGTTCNVAHDAVGNVVSQPTRDGTRQLTYFNSGAVRTISQQNAQAHFRYDPFGQIRELEVTGSGLQEARQELRFGKHIEVREQTAGGTASSVILRHIPGPAGIVATLRGSGGEWIFEFGEARGNRLFADQSGTFVQKTDYEPFGEASTSGAAPGTPNYTSYQWNHGDVVAPFGLSQLGARLYDPVIGRFLSRDPIAIPWFGSSTNPYAFALNDPLNASDPSGLQVEQPQPMTPLTPFDFWGAADSGCLPGLCAPEQVTPAPDPWAVPAQKSGSPAIAPSVSNRRAELTVALAAGNISKSAASARFQDFIRKKIYTKQKFECDGGRTCVGFCAGASRQMALKHAGIVQLGLSRGKVAHGLSKETSDRAKKDGKWFYWHFNENIKLKDRPMFSDPQKLHPDAISQIARNASVGTGSQDRLRWTPIDADQARKFLDEGALVVVGTEGLAHWMTVIRDPFSGNYVFLDPYADTTAGQLLVSGSMKSVPPSPDGPEWGAVVEYHVLVHE